MRYFRKPARRREKVFGPGQAIPMDRNAKVRVWKYAEGYTAKHRRRGQHRGPLTRAYLDVLRALLWHFHNQHSGRCFPGYERIAEVAHVNRATVGRAIKALEAAGVLTWENRLVRVRIIEPGLTGPTMRLVPRRTSNAYRFLDPQPPSRPILPKAQNSPVTENQDFLSLSKQVEIPLEPGLEAVLLSLRRAIATAGTPSG